MFLPFLCLCICNRVCTSKVLHRHRSPGWLPSVHWVVWAISADHRIKSHVDLSYKLHVKDQVSLPTTIFCLLSPQARCTFLKGLTHGCLSQCKDKGINCHLVFIWTISSCLIEIFLPPFDYSSGTFPWTTWLNPITRYSYLREGW